MYSCPPGQVVTGLHVAWAAAPVAPFTNLATGEWSSDFAGVQRGQLFLSGGFSQLRPSSCLLCCPEIRGCLNEKHGHV